MTARHPLLLLGALLTLGCSDSTAPARLDGSWAQQFTIPGNSIAFTLTTQGNVVSGAGTWTGEACCAGPVTIVGDDTGGDVNLDFTFTANGLGMRTFTTHFTGHLTDPNTLSGVTTNGGTSSPDEYRRVR